MIEIETIRSGAGWFRQPDRALLSVGGSDRITFLNGQLSQDIEVLAVRGPGAGAYGLVLTVQGRIVADFHILLHEDEIWLECERARIDALRERLDKYLVADDVELRDVSERFARFSIEGPGARSAIAADGPLPDENCYGTVSVDGIHFGVAAYGMSGYPALQLFVEPAESDVLEQRLLERGLARGLVPATAETLEVLRVEAGIPASRSELTDDVLPAESGVLERAVSFSKGCYTGQEVVARMASRGRVSHRLVGIKVEGSEAINPGDMLYKDARKVGEITSVVRSPLYGHIALAFVRDAHHEAGTQVTLEGGKASLRISALPFREKERE